MGAKKCCMKNEKKKHEKNMKSCLIATFRPCWVFFRLGNKNDKHELMQNEGKLQKSLKSSGD